MNESPLKPTATVSPEDGLQVAIGLEIHAQLNTLTKAFCSTPVKFGAPPNSMVCPVCLGLPGALPVTNQKAVELSVMVALALQCDVHLESWFDRKCYLYPDLPKGYQITQYERPLAVGGWLDYLVDGEEKRANITRVHMEEDAGKLIHPGDGAQGQSATQSQVDFNRAGVPLVEIVTAPDFRTPREAASFLKALHGLLRWLEVSNANMEEGGLRCDANLSVGVPGEGSVRTELKNLNSFRNLERALEFEGNRQIELVTTGGKVNWETRLWDEKSGRTRVMRSKGAARDYRYGREPDLPPLRLEDSDLKRMAATLPPSPFETARSYQATLGLSRGEASLLCEDRATARFFEATVGAGASAALTASWIASELRHLNPRAPVDKEQCRTTPDHLAKLLNMVENRTITRAVARDVFRQMYHGGARPGDLVREQSLERVGRPEALRETVDSVVNNYPRERERLLQGDTRLVSFFMGRVMLETGGRADPLLVKDILENLSEGTQEP